MSKKKQKAFDEMVAYLEQIFNVYPLRYTCKYCVIKAYNEIISKEEGYITDEDLIEISNGKLKHM